MSVSRIRAHLIALEQSQPEAIRLEVIARGKESWIEGLCDALKERSGYCPTCERVGYQRWAFRLYAELAQLVGAAPQLAVQIVNMIGTDPQRAKSAVGMLDRVERMDDDAAIAECERFLSEQYAKRGLPIPQWPVR